MITAKHGQVRARIGRLDHLSRVIRRLGLPGRVETRDGLSQAACASALLAGIDGMLDTSLPARTL